jgi:small conductance mechanosensitive channel
MKTLTLLLSLTLAWGQDQPSVQSTPDQDPELQALIEEAQVREAPIRDLLAVYRRMDGLGDVRIRMEGQVLELEGSALTPEDRDRAGQLAERLTGALYVDNRIEVERTLSKRLAPAAERFREKGTAFVQFLPVLTVGLLLFGLTVLAAIWVGRPRFPYERLTPNVFAQSVLRQVARTVVVLTGILLTLELLGATALVGAVLGTAGLFGLGIGFAFRDIAENYLSGILLSLRQPFAPMDHVQLSGHEGKVVRLTGRETILMTLDGNHVRIPNTLVFKGVLTNFTRNPRRRFQIQVGIAPDEDLTRALRVGKQAILDLPGILEHPPVTGRVQELAASSVELRFSGWVDQGTADYGKVRSEATRVLKEALEGEGVRTPPPEYGIRILEGSTAEAAPTPGPTPREATRPPDPAKPTSEADVAPDTTIEEQIAEDLRQSKEENFLDGPTEEPPGTSTEGSAGEAGRP